MTRPIFGILAAALLAGCATTAQPPSAAPPAPAPAAAASRPVAEDFQLRDIEGRDVHLSDFNGKVVLMDFWATWCTPCAAELPHLERFYETYKDRGLVVLGISMDGPETEASVPSFARRYGLTFPVMVDEETRVTGLYNPKRSAPLSILIDRGSHVARTREGYSIGDEKLIEADIQDLIAR